MLEMVIAGLQWLFIVGIWSFTVVGFYRSYQELKCVCRPADKRSRISDIRQTTDQSLADEWLMPRSLQGPLVVA